MTEFDLMQELASLAGPNPPKDALSFFRYILTMRDNAVAAFHDDAFLESVVEIRHWRLHTFLINDPAGIRRVLVDNAANYIKGDIQCHISRIGRNDGFAASDEKEWRPGRRFMSSSFDSRSILDNSSVNEDAVQNLLARWSALPSGTVVEVSTEMARLTLEIVCRVIFSSDGAGFPQIMESASQRYGEEAMIDPLDLVPGLDRVWRVYKRRRRRQIFKELDESIARIVAKRAAEGAHLGNDLLDRLLELRDPESGSGLSTQEVHRQLITMLGAGHESVAASLAWTWYLLSQHPMVEARLHAELDEVLGGCIPTADDLAKLPYTRMILAESMRLYPPIHTLAWRGAVEDDDVCGVRIPKGATVSIAPWVLHRHAKLWEHPERFDPDRFSAERSQGRSPFAYLPFGVGPRVCVAASFATKQAMLILATVAQRYRLRLAPGHKVEPRGLVSLKARHGIRMTMEDRY